MIEKLKELYNTDVKDHFLIIEIDSLYIQFVCDRNRESIYSEAIGPKYIKNKAFNFKEVTSNFRKIGFTEPNMPNELTEIGSENYNKSYNLTETSFENIIDEAIYIFEKIYDLKGSFEILYELYA